MRDMAFTITTQQMYSGTKTVTRRLGWWLLKPGDIVMAVEKGMGLKKGEHVKKIYPIEIVKTSGEPLSVISQREVILEGFPEMTPKQFVDMFCLANDCRPYFTVNRIEFRKATL